MIVQFGTSRFLQAHVDLFAWEAALAGQDVPDIAVVQVSGDAGRAARLRAFNDPDGFPVLIRGLEQGTPVEGQTQVRSVKRGLSVRQDWDAVCDLFIHHASHIVSNSGDSGFEIADEDRKETTFHSPKSFCAILLRLLHLRWEAGRPGLTLLPCELVAANGSTLHGILHSLASELELEPEFLSWLGTECLWVNTLVDRIVSAPLEPAGAVAEPYALWAIEKQPRLRMPFAHPAVLIVEDLQQYERLKLHILNLGHSLLAEDWLQAGADPNVTVGTMVRQPLFADRLKQVYSEEVIPGFAAMGWEAEARDYIAMTLERFANPYLEHRLADIYAHHAVKVSKRVGAFIDWVDAGHRPIRMTRLCALAASYGRAQ